MIVFDLHIIAYSIKNLTFYYMYVILHFVFLFRIPLFHFVLYSYPFIVGSS